MKKDSTVNMTPTKEFFIFSLIRDINLNKAILDLIDNSIEGAKRFVKDSYFSRYYIKITITKNKFIIEDNCGGISKEDICNYAFRFGHENNSNLKEFSASGFGIGMKRAFFKMGNKIIVESNSENSYFCIDLNIKKWKRTDNWNIYLKKEGDSKKGVKGTKIIISELYENISKDFSSEKFVNKLKKEINRTYRQILKQHIQIIVNRDILTVNREIEKEIFRTSYKVNSIMMRIIVKKGEYSLEESGWNISFNRRTIVYLDKSKLSGWGYNKLYDEIETPKFDERFYTFRGYLDVECKNPYLLPFNTTKDGIDINSDVYKKMRKYMIDSVEKTLSIIVKDKNISITYQKPIREVEMLKNFLKVNSARQVGIKTYEEYLKILKSNNTI
ncbi:ATP-binding protein [Clostridium aestuarii]|uniref:ATP-binding protein n=1 Tax=Clostridium aestuarii TaxID=338193 RepID=A0ABT4D1D6_9CLOT|nr:ATP-binding protein [Clostridium aestuarii]MCY6485059.1 ATP-binding protein [Clostridium aestuarii]